MTEEQGELTLMKSRPHMFTARDQASSRLPCLEAAHLLLNAVQPPEDALSVIVAELGIGMTRGRISVVNRSITFTLHRGSMSTAASTW